MEAEKKKRLEDQLRQMLAKATNRSQENTPSVTAKPRSTRVIRRRKGQPDIKIV
jgi:hypothetical protein